MKLFKKLLSILLCLAALFMFGCNNSGSAEDTKTTEPQGYVDPGGTISDGKVLKVLAITSSFGLNTTELLYEIAKAEGAEEVIVARLYASGCTLAMILLRLSWISLITSSTSIRIGRSLRSCRILTQGIRCWLLVQMGNQVGLSGHIMWR